MWFKSHVYSFHCLCLNRWIVLPVKISNRKRSALWLKKFFPLRLLYRYFYRYYKYTIQWTCLSHSNWIVTYLFFKYLNTVFIHPSSPLNSSPSPPFQCQQQTLFVASPSRVSEVWGAFTVDLIALSHSASPPGKEIAKAQ